MEKMEKITSLPVLVAAKISIPLSKNIPLSKGTQRSQFNICQNWREINF